MSTTLSDLQRQAQTLPSRIVDAVMSGDPALLTQVQQEKTTLPAQLFAVEIAELRATMIELRAEIADDKEAVERTGAIVRGLVDQRKETERRILTAERDYGHARNAYEFSKEALRQAENRLEEIAASQIALAQSLTARPGLRPRP